MSSAPILLILGAGSNIGHGVAEAFKAKGYRVALVARSIEDANTPTELRIKADLADTSVVPKIFEKVKETFGSPPSVVVYNAFSRTLNDPASPLDISFPQLEIDTAVNTYSLISSASQAILGFKTLPPSSSRTFIFTGNMLNEIPNPACLGFGIGKSSAAHLINLSALVYGSQGMKFYYADERLADGMPAMKARSGVAAGKFYVSLAEGEGQGVWRATHVGGVYRGFGVVDRLPGQTGVGFGN